MGLFHGKKGLVFGIANDHSLAWAITQQLHAEGAQMGFTHLPDKPGKRPAMERRLWKLVKPIGAKLIMPCDVQNDDHLNAVFTAARKTFKRLDFIVHSIAFAPTRDLKRPTVEVSREAFKTSMEISVYSLLAIVNRARKLLNPGGSVLTLTYLGGERVIPGYNIMGLCKSALESSVEYMAHDLGPAGIRVNALSAGPVKTLSASAVGDFDQMLKLYEKLSPLRRSIVPEEVGRTGMFLLSELSSGVTGETFHVDAGYHVMGAARWKRIRNEPQRSTIVERLSRISGVNDHSSSNHRSSADDRRSIGIAVVEHGGCYLVGTRGVADPLPGLDEFPGGKCRPGEAPRDCAVRECREETGLEVVAEELLLNRRFDYPHAAVDLHFWLCRPRGLEAIPQPHHGFRWVAVGELHSLRFPEANEPLVELLQARSSSRP